MNQAMDAYLSNVRLLARTDVPAHVWNGKKKKKNLKVTLPCGGENAKENNILGRAQSIA
jgi:hypothetical protein